MKRTLLILAFLWGLPLWAQTTVVSGTIADQNGQTYFYGTYKIEFWTNGLPSPFFLNGAPFDPFSPANTFSGPLDGTGSFAGVVVPSSNFITPTGTGWRFTVCPAASTQCFQKTLSVTGATLVVTSLIIPPAITVNANQFSQPSAYQDSEVLGANLGFSYYNQTRNFGVPTNSHTLRLCVGAVPCTWVDIGGGVGGSTLCNIFNGVLVCATPVEVENNGYGIEKANAASGTTCGLSVSLDAAGNAITTVNGAINGSIGVASILQPLINAGGTATNCGTSGNVFVGNLGNFTLTFDNQTTINDYVVIGANGKFHDAGAAEPTGVQVIGLVTSTNFFPGTPNANADIWTGDHVGANGARGTLCYVNGVVVAGTACNFNSTTPAAPANFQNLPVATDNATPVSNVVHQVPQATTGQAGIVKLAQDFCGTFSLPIVCGIQTIPVTFSSIAIRDVFCFVTTISIQNCKLGVPPRLVAGTTDTVLATDRGGWIIADGVALAETVPTAASLGGQNFFFNETANGSGSVTLTFSSGETVTKNAASGTSSGTLVITAGSWCNITSDVNSTANWYADCTGGGGGSGVSSVFIENLTPDTTGLVLWTVDPSTNFRDGYWDWSHTIASATSLYGKVRIPHVLPSGTAKIILSQLAANDATAGHTMTFQVCTITVTTTLHVGAPTCTATQNFTTTTTAYGPMDLTFTVPTALSIDTQLDVVITATTESGLVADVQLEGVSFQWE